MRRRRVPVATHRAVLLQAWRGAQRRIEMHGATQLSPREDAGRLLARWESPHAAMVFACAGACVELERVVEEEEGVGTCVKR